jgi:hypothetical protein
MVAYSHRHALLTTCSSQARWQAQGQRRGSALLVPVVHRPWYHA